MKENWTEYHLVSFLTFTPYDVVNCVTFKISR